MLNIRAHAGLLMGAFLGTTLAYLQGAVILATFGFVADRIRAHRSRRSENAAMFIVVDGDKLPHPYRAIDPTALLLLVIYNLFIFLGIYWFPNFVVSWTRSTVWIVDIVGRFIPAIDSVELQLQQKNLPRSYLFVLHTLSMTWLIILLDIVASAIALVFKETVGHQRIVEAAASSKVEPYRYIWSGLIFLLVPTPYLFFAFASVVDGRRWSLYHPLSGLFSLTVTGFLTYLGLMFIVSGIATSLQRRRLDPV
jgi:hypothetical protein